MTTETLLELVEIILKNNIFQFIEKTLKQVRGTAIGTKFTPPYAIIFMADLEERILKDTEHGGGIPMIYFSSENMEKIL